MPQYKTLEHSIYVMNHYFALVIKDRRAKKLLILTQSIDRLLPQFTVKAQIALLFWSLPSLIR